MEEGDASFLHGFDYSSWLYGTSLMCMIASLVSYFVLDWNKAQQGTIDMFFSFFSTMDIGVLIYVHILKLWLTILQPAVWQQLNLP